MCAIMALPLRFSLAGVEVGSVRRDLCRAVRFLFARQGVEVGERVQVDVIRPEELDSPDLARWDQIQAENAELDSPFLSARFAVAVGAVRGDTRVAVLSSERGTVAFFPFEKGRGGRGMALAKGLSDVQGVVAPATMDLDLAGTMRACGLRLFEFDHLLAAQEGWFTSLPSRFILETSPALNLSAGFDAYLSQKQTTSKSLFQSTARKRRKLERDHGPIRLAFHEPDHRMLDQVLCWKSSQYRRTGRRDRFADAGNRALVHALLDVHDATFGAPLTTLHAGDSLVAAHLGLRSRHTLAWWFPVYDPAFAAYSPGLILCLDLARAMAAERLSLLDLGKGDESYKDRLSNTSLRLLNGTVAHNRPGQALHTVRRWPAEQVMSLVLGSPRLRELSRSALARAGGLRERLARSPE
jgi:CelD/BcsL family acetyltransferase involved in cellulose biosynthesis